MLVAFTLGSSIYSLIFLITGTRHSSINWNPKASFFVSQSCSVQFLLKTPRQLFKIGTWDLWSSLMHHIYVCIKNNGRDQAGCLNVPCWSTLRMVGTRSSPSCIRCRQCRCQDRALGGSPVRRYTWRSRWCLRTSDALSCMDSWHTHRCLKWWRSRRVITHTFFKKCVFKTVDF